MRFEGTIKSWNEAKGFGFLASTQGGQDVFVHVSALPRGSGVPRVGQAFSFEVELNREGKKRAVRVAPAGQAYSAPRRSHPREREGRSPVAVLVGFVLVLVIGAAAYGKFGGLFTRLAASDAGSESIAVQAAPVEVPVLFRCDGRTHCSQMSSCAEAKYFLKNCPGVKMDGNGDGVPCEQQWCTSLFAR
ncbi:cold shock domain-containing protein [Variovorax sp. OV329]|uniref:cold shock domain-containing protein n=1 Tax=Variovorax sp. OV329 TaxID=1882825 RepID=UPI0008F34269|nr:cold shock domain-containing protein [Variovorax sp. OV329]SFM75478.1 cold-shock DNA-binding protein family [Variovorax sp. OV329]